MHLLILPLIAFNLRIKNKNTRTRYMMDIANYGLTNSIIHSNNLIGELHESQTKEREPISQNQ